MPGYHEAMPETKAVSLGDDSSDFFDTLLDIVNPLQHLPGVSTVYRAITGDEISTPARLLGGALFGGPLGFASAAANMALEQATGDDLAGLALAFIDEIDGSLDLASALPPLAEDGAPEPESVINVAAADGPVDIIWNGPRVLPSLARSGAVQVGAAGDVVLDGSDGRPTGGDIAGVAHQLGSVTPPSAQPTTPPVRPAWLEAAIADAQLVHDATQLGDAAQQIDAQPWITDAMLEALGKYETLARERERR